MANPSDSEEDVFLVFGMCAAVGSCVSEVEEVLAQVLKGYGFDVRRVLLKDMIEEFSGKKGLSKREFQDYGDMYRIDQGVDALAKGVVEQMRQESTGGRVAYIVGSLRHPGEREYLKEVLGNHFLQISVHREEPRRRESLMQELGDQAQVEEIIQIDRNRLEVDEYVVEVLDERLKNDENGGSFQNVERVFRLGDLFVRGRKESEEGFDRMCSDVERFVDLCAGNAFITPNRDEYAMHMAYSASLRSGDLGRQVGAVIADSAGYIVSIGWNEVPKAGGGVYQEGDLEDNRDFTKDRLYKYQLIDEYKEHLFSGQLYDDEGKEVSGELADEFEQEYAQLTEYSRTMHGEMAAITGAARRGVSINGAVMYCTTFPCHNCMKHIIAAGIRRVYFLDAYAKSLSFLLHGEELTVEQGGKRIEVMPHTGVHPWRMDTLFRRIEGKLHKRGYYDKWNKSNAVFNAKLKMSGNPIL